jgi:hypothetical protein
MLKNKLVWYVNMAGAAGGWLFIFVGLAVNFESCFIQTAWWVVLLVWTILHPLELAISLPIGKKAGVSLERTIIMTLIFGFTWWLPVKLGVFER